jgi:hypothetical protein
MRTVKFDYCTQLYDSPSISFLSRITDLRQLSLRGCTTISQAAVLQLAVNIKGLKELDLSSCKQLPEELISAISSINSKLFVIVDLYHKRCIGKRAPNAKYSREKSIKERYTNIPRDVSLIKPGSEFRLPLEC